MYSIHQAGIIQLSDEVTIGISGLNFRKEELKAQRDAYHQICAELEQVLEFLRLQFYQYFDVDHKATIFHSRLLASMIGEFEPDLRNYAHPAVDHSLIETVIISAGDKCAEGFISGTSYRQADQVLNLVRTFHNMLLFGTNPTTDGLIRVLYQQNFNSLHFYNWYRDFSLMRMNTISGQQELQAYFETNIRELAGIYVSPEKAFQPELPSTDMFLIPWLRQQAGSEEKKTQFKPKALQVTAKFIRPAIRVIYPQYCYKDRLLSRLDNVASDYQVFYRTFHHQKTSRIYLHKSFGRAFYNLDQSAAAVVRDYLQKMLNYLR